MSELYHFGIKRRSGRYPYGSGERPYQGEKRSLSYRVGEKRLTNRLDVTAGENDKYAVKAGLKNNLMSLDFETLNEQTKNILTDLDRVEKIGYGTILRRVGAGTLAGTATAGICFIAAAMNMPLAAAASLVPLGMNYIYYKKTTY